MKRNYCRRLGVISLNCSSMLGPQNLVYHCVSYDEQLTFRVVAHAGGCRA